MSAVGSQFDITPLEPRCPWYSWTRPNVKWCENNLCAYITAPANTYSNLLYIFLGFLMIKRARQVRSKTLGMFGPASIWAGEKEYTRGAKRQASLLASLLTNVANHDLAGVSSFAFHASYTYVFQIFDYFGMFCFVNLALVVNMRRLNLISAANQHKVYWGLVVVCTIVVPILGHFNFPYQLLVFGQVIFTLLQEIYLNRKSTKKGRLPKYGHYLT